MIKNIYPTPDDLMDLQRFGEGEGDGGGETYSAAADDTGIRQDDAGSEDLSAVKYGVQEEETGVATGEKAAGEAAKEKPAPDLSSEFEQLINGKYKEQYAKRVQDTVKSRLKSSKAEKDRLDKLKAAVSPIAEKYGITDLDDIDGLSKAISGDKSLYEAEADARGMNVNDYMHMKDLERQNRQMSGEIAKRAEEERTERMYQSFIEESEGLKKIFPSFDLNAEMANPEIDRLLRLPGYSLTDAFYKVHADEIRNATIQMATQMAEQQTARKIAAGSGRPAETGARTTPAARIKNDVNSLTDADIDEIIARAERGEKIRF